MAKPRLLRAEGIVIKRVDFGEADKLLTIYTPFEGKRQAIAKGARRPTSKLGGHVELFTHSHLLIAKGRNLDIVSQSETMHAFAGLRDDLRRASYACYVAELLDRLSAEHVENHPVFVLLLETLRRLAEGRTPEIAVRVFEMQLLGYLGYRPELHRCVHCQSSVEAAGSYYSPFAGGVLCRECGRGQPAARELTARCFKVLRVLQAGDYATASRLRLEPALREEMEGVLRSQVTYVLEGEVRSAAVWRSVAAGLAGANPGRSESDPG